MKRSLILAFVFCLYVCTGCYYDIEEELYGSVTACDTTNVTFSQSVNTILQNNGCIGCHSGGTPSGNINLLGYSNVKAQVDNNRLYGAINHSSGFSPMPKGGNKLSSCDINKIKTWIEAGAFNN